LGDVPTIQLETLHKRADYLSHGSLLRVFSKNPLVEYRHADFLFQDGSWQGTAWKALSKLKELPRALVIGHSDTVISAEVVSRIFEEFEIQSIFATNLSSEARTIAGVHDLPLGIPNRDNSTKTHRIQSARSPLLWGWKLGRQASASLYRGVYANFSIATNPRVRVKVQQIIKRCPHVFEGTYAVSRWHRFLEMRNIGRWGLNVCPEGNGPDTHRVWETLLVGAYPVVLKSDHVSRLLKALRLPHVSLNSWEELADDGELSRAFYSLRNQRWSYESLANQFWVEKVLRHVDNVSTSVD
jgi:hypothetical protein